MKNIYILTLATALLVANSAHVLAAGKSQSQTEQYITNFVGRYAGCEESFGDPSIEIKSPNIVYTEPWVLEGEAFEYVSSFSINNISEATLYKTEKGRCRSRIALGCVADSNCISQTADGDRISSARALNIHLSASLEDAEKLKRAFEHLNKLNFDVDDF